MYLLFFFGFRKICKNASFVVEFQCFLNDFLIDFWMISQCLLKDWLSWFSSIFKWFFEWFFNWFWNERLNPQKNPVLGFVLGGRTKSAVRAHNHSYDWIIYCKRRFCAGSRFRRWNRTFREPIRPIQNIKYEIHNFLDFSFFRFFFEIFWKNFRKKNFSSLILDDILCPDDAAETERGAQNKCNTSTW